MVQKINWDYLKQTKDPYILLKTHLIKKHKSTKKYNRILVVNPCLVGDFIVSLPALRTFIKKNKNSKIDLLVSPPIKELAEKIKGIEKVFVAKSSTSRDIENSKKGQQKFGEYDKVVIMRISEEAYNLIKKIKTKEIDNPFWKVINYQYVSLIKDSLTKKFPEQRRKIDFKILNLPYREVNFKEVFNFNENDYEKIRKLPPMKTKEKIVIIHTGPVWVMREWENKKWAELIRKINSSGNYRFVFVGTGEAKKDFEEISKRLDFKVYSFIDKINLMELMLILRLSNCLIGVDSGPRNMAHLADLRSITLFGPAASGAIYMPWSKKDIVIDKSNGGGAYEALFYKKKGYIHSITVEEVFEAFKKIKKTK